MGSYEIHLNKKRTKGTKIFICPYNHKTEVVSNCIVTPLWHEHNGVLYLLEEVRSLYAAFRYRRTHKAIEY